MLRTYCVLLLWALVVGLLSSVQVDGNTTATVNCTLCVDPLATPNDPDARIDTGVETLSCQQIHNRGVWTLPEDNCTALQNFGRDICSCEAALPVINNCSLCDDGSPLGQPLYEGLPGETCAELQVEARRDLASNCYAWQGTVGIWCGCPKNIVSNVRACRLCGDDIALPNPLEMAEDDNDFSCGALEFQASIPGANCSAYREDFAEFCCRNIPLQDTSTSNGVVAKASLIVLMVSLVSTLHALVV